MNTKVIAGFLVVGALFAPLATRAADSTTDGSKASVVVKDSVITTKIKAELAKEKVRSLIHIHVDTDRNGAVVLSGNAKTQQDIDAATTIAKAVDGVTSVQNNVKIKADM